jgi:hypothetical protein
LTIFILSNNGNLRSDLMADEIAKFLLETDKSPSTSNY